MHGINKYKLDWGAIENYLEIGTRSLHLVG